MTDTNQIYPKRSSRAILRRRPSSIGGHPTGRAAASLLRTQRDLASALAATDDLTQALDLSLRTALQLTRIDCGGIYLVDPATGTLDLACHRGLSAPFATLTACYEADTHQARLVMAGQPVYMPYSQFAFADDILREGEGLRACAIIPVLYQGQVIAALNLASRTCDDIPSGARNTVEAIAAQIGGALARMRTAAELTASQQSWQTIFDTLDDMLFVLSTAGMILRVNPAVERRLGYTGTELAGRHVLAVHPPERRDEAAAVIAQMLAGQIDVCTVPLLAKDGTRIPVETNVVRSRWYGQAVLFGISREVTERHRFEAALRNSEEQLRAIIENSPSAIILFDPDGCIRLWNAAAERMYGWCAQEVLGRTLPTVPTEKQYERLNFQARVNQGELIPYTEVERRRKDGSVIHVGLSVAPLRDAAGTFYAQMSITADITERVQMAQALRASEDHYRQLLKHVPAPVFIYALDDAERTILYVNDMAQALWQARGGAGSLVGMSAMQVIQSDKRFSAVPEMDELRAGTRQGFVAERLVGPDGQALDVVASSTAITYEGRPVVMLLINDVTPLKRAQAELVRRGQMLAALEERELLARELHDGLGQMLAYLNVQAPAAQILLAQGKTSAVRATLEQMTQVAHEAQDNIRKHILGLRARDRAPGNVFQALEASLRQFSVACGIPATLSVPKDAPQPAFAPAVEEQVLYIIQEALVNIRKHAAAHKVEVWFSFSEQQAQVMIADDGVGFEPTALNASEPGVHFGLRIMAERAAQIGGRLEVRAAPGQGCRILVDIPRLLSGSIAPMPEDEALLQNLRVLVVDDHPLFLEGIRQLLVARGITVVGAAHDGSEAQELARTLQPDVILMDVEMAPCNGLEATRAIKAEMPHIKVVMLTVSEDADNLLVALRSGASGYLLKSLDANVFVRLLASVVRGEAQIPPAFAGQVLLDFAQRPSALPTRAADQPLNPRQQEILRQMALGLTYKEIAAAHNMSVQGIKYHVGQILDRLNLTTRKQAIAYARRVLLD